ncbi:DNA mismatch repair protein MutS [Lactobacillus terrae]|uniref:DNA mismatch repair protein MutS n=1 Tax=Lactobacillus terrae TaxID=2269374 RepID=UPI000C1B6DB4|nr:DNA mismatch repair protein MutS [Lactobacillus terrae]
MPQKNKETPMMQQYVEMKKNYPDAFLMYRVGDFYEMFYEDAVKASQILELTLTSRNKNSDNNIPMCGVPHHAVQGYIDTLIEKGYKVAICDQLEDPSMADGMVKRGITRVVTPGTIMDESANNSNENNYITAVTNQKQRFGLAYADLSTGEVKVTSFDSYDELVNELQNLNTRETIVSNTFALKYQEPIIKRGILISTAKDNDENLDYNFDNLTEELQINTVQILINYFQETQLRALDHLKPAQSYKPSSYLQMDYNVQSNLELFKNIRTNKKSGTLLWLLDETQTAMGGRLLKQWISRPLVDKNELLDRQHILQLFLDNFFQRSSLQDYLTKVYDLERLAGRVAYGTVNGRDLIQLKSSLEQIPKIKEILLDIGDEALTREVDAIDACDDIYGIIDDAIVDDPPISVTSGGLIKTGYNDQLDEYIDASKNGKNWIAQLLKKEQEVTGISNLKVGYNKVFGYYIEVSKGNVGKVPEDRYQRKQTLTNAERYITPELKEKETLILEADDKSQALEYELFDGIRQTIKKEIRRIQELATIISRLDVLQSFAVVSENYHYTKPNFVDKRTLNIVDGRHPVVEKVLSNNSYIPNDVEFDEKTDVALITGPNMSGKSTYMRQLALSVVMAQIGCYIPAEKADMPIFDRIFTRIGAADDLISGDSTFMVEMREANDALKNATEHSLIIFDEIGRGTATYDGMALAQSIIEYIVKNVHAITMFSTHYHELTELTEELPGVKNVHVDASEENGTLVFLHKVLPGPADKSYGIHVAKLAGLPTQVLKRADSILINLENQEKHVEVSNDTPELKIEESQLSLFEPNDDENEVLTDIRNQDLMDMTPMEAMNLLYKWQKSIR